MCGIAGIYSHVPRELGYAVVKMAEAMAHRGPDDFGYLATDPGSKMGNCNLHEMPSGSHKVFLSHRRLSIIDVGGTRQPLGNEDGTVWTIFNGEVYNYEELGADLQKRGHVLREKGDTEVLVHLWEEYGEEMLHKLVGMFVFAIYDGRKDVLFIARDRFGQKPLYYADSNGDIIFASELQCLLASKLMPLETELSSVARFFRYGYVPSPETIYKGIMSLPAGHSLCFRNSIATVKQYWKPSVNGSNEPDYDRIQHLLDESVRLRLKTDVPFGVFLSSGIDSSIIAASMKEQMEEQVKTFTITTGKNWFDESEGARNTADFLKAEHHEIKVEPDFIAISELLAKHFGQPFADHSSVLTYYVSKATRQHVKVALGGDGGDELFAGYDSYLNLRKYAFMDIIPPMLRKLIAQSLSRIKDGSGSPNYLFDSVVSAATLPGKGENISSLFHEYWREFSFSDDFSGEIKKSELSDIERFTRYFNDAESDDILDKWLEADQRMYLCDDILCKVDISSMAVSLECRSPFLDHRLAEYANTIKSSSKIFERKTKYILKQLALRRLPREIVSRPKKGFSMPLGKWIRNELKDWFNSMIFDNRELWSPYLRETAVRRLWAEHQSGRIDHQARLWTIVSLVLWRKVDR